MPPLIDLTGKRFGRLVVLSLGPKTKDGKRKWLCRCDCGKEKAIPGDSLRSGHTKSCGCRQNRTTHGKSGTPEYRSYIGMMHRCHSPKAKAYKHYGGRGITVCDRWRNSIEAFLSDMGPRPSPNHSIDRIDNDGDYEPSNTRWATVEEQGHNQRSTVLTEELAREVRQVATQGGNIAAWAREHGVNAKTAGRAARGETWK